MKQTGRTALASGVLLTVLGLSACSAGSSMSDKPAATAAPAAEHNKADVTFAGHMVLHHQQAVQLASIAGYFATSPAVKRFAVVIQTGHEPEMKQLTARLTAWGETVPSPSHSHDPADEIPGMLGEDEMSALGKTEGRKFDRLWLQVMIRNHQGALAMAKTEQTGGKDVAAITLAKDIQAAQTVQITAMQKQLQRLPKS